MKASDVMASVKAKKLLNQPDSATGLKQVWIDTVQEVYGPKYFGPFTMKQMGQFKHLLKACPGGRGAAVVSWAIRHWIKFVKAVEEAAGVKTTPAQPSIEFLLKHVGIAINLAFPVEKKSAGKIVPKAVQYTPPVQLISQPEPEEDKPKTLAELMAILNAPGE